MDNRLTAPDAYITAPIWNWGLYYVNQVQAIMDGNWKSSSYHGGIEEGICLLATLTDLAPTYPKEATTTVDTAQNKIFDGSLQIFKGPIIDQTGAVKVPEGKVLSYDEIMGTGMNWFVKGVEGKIVVQK